MNKWIIVEKNDGENEDSLKWQGTEFDLTWDIINKKKRLEKLWTLQEW